MLGTSQELLLKDTQLHVNEGMLHICMNCYGLTYIWNPSRGAAGGDLHGIAVLMHGKLKDKVEYTFPLHSEFK